MHNWCEGHLKIRGKRENVLKFLTEGVNCYRSTYDKEKDEYNYFPIEKNLLYEMDKDYFYYLQNDIFVEGTTRGFISNFGDIIYLGPEKKENSYIFLKFRQAWVIRTEELAAISEKYSLDFKIYAAERGIGAAQDIEIHNGQIVKNEEIHYKSYDDFIWNCPTPDNGG